MNIISDNQIVSARKEYACDASYLILQVFSSFNRFIEDFSDQVTEEEIKALRKAESQDCKILKGDSYRKVFYNQDGEAVTFRGLTEVEKICQNYDIYEEE